jgi:hypothetical protein
MGKTTVLNHINSDLRDKFEPNNLKAVKGTKVVRIDLTSGEIGTMWQPAPQHPSVISFDDKIAPVTILKTDSNQYTNPLIIPNIHIFANKVSALNAQRTGKEGPHSIPKPADGHAEDILQQKADKENSKTELGG